MNLELLESFGQNYPEEFDGALDCISLAVTCSFNKRGTLLAVGCNDGRIVVWDFLTRGIAKIVSAHVHPVCSLSWSRNGHKLVSASTDNGVAIWDVLQGECDQRYRFPSPILKVQVHPRNDNIFLVCPMKYAAVLVHVDGSHTVVPLDEEVNTHFSSKLNTIWPKVSGHFTCVHIRGMFIYTTNTMRHAKFQTYTSFYESDVNIVASFDRRGQSIYTGNAKGKILVLSCPSMELIASFRVTTGTSNTTAIKSIEFARRGNCFLVNTADRIIRVYESGEVLACGKEGEPEPIQKLQDLVNKTMWKKCVFSGDGEYICAGSARQHALYIWEKSIGNLVKILHGTKGELLLDVVWHPVRPIIASISSGVVSIWAQNQVENWSAFAPDFKELDENVEYEERESEFDIEDEDKSVELNTEKQEDDEEVDVVTVEKIAAFCSSDEDDDDDDSNALIYLPISPEIDEPEEGWGAPVDQPTEEQSSKRSTLDHKENASPSKKKRYKTYDVNLTNAPSDESHPLLNVKTKDKLHGPKKSGRPKSIFSSHSSSSKSSDQKSHKVKHKEGRGSSSIQKQSKGDSSRSDKRGSISESPFMEISAQESGSVSSSHT